MTKKEDELVEKKGKLVDWYKKIPKTYLNKYHNPNYNQHKIAFPFFGLLVGSTGSGKTQTLLNIVKQFENTFEKMILCVKNVDEPLYKWLISTIPSSQLEVYENGDVPPVSKYKDCESQIIIIFDDLLNEPKSVQSKITDWFIYGRKTKGGAAMIYLSQSFYRIPKTIRVQANYIFLKRLTTNRDLRMVLSEYGLTSIKDQVERIYRDITKESKIPFLLISTDNPPEERFRKNFDCFIQVEDKL
jgi:hypothetical protein